MEKSSEAGRRGLNLLVVDDISGRGTIGREGAERSCEDRPEGVKTSRSRGGRGLVGSAVGTGKGEC